MIGIPSPCRFGARSPLLRPLRRSGQLAANVRSKYQKDARNSEQASLIPNTGGDFEHVGRVFRANREMLDPAGPSWTLLDPGLDPANIRLNR